MHVIWHMDVYMMLIAHNTGFLGPGFRVVSCDKHHLFKLLTSSQRPHDWGSTSIQYFHNCFIQSNQHQFERECEILQRTTSLKISIHWTMYTESIHSQYVSHKWTASARFSFPAVHKKGNPWIQGLHRKSHTTIGENNSIYYQYII